MSQANLIEAITLDDNIAKISVLEVPDKPGIAFGLFTAIAQEDIRIESIVQNVNRNNVNDITFTVALEQAETAKRITEDFAATVGASEVVSDENVARLSVVGSAAVADSKVAARFFKALYEIGINIQMISTSEVKISAVIDKTLAREGIKQIYREFGSV